MGRTIEVSDETYESIKDQLDANPTNKAVGSFEEMIGNNYFFRTVTYHLVGTVIDIIDGFVVLKNASWVADSGRFSAAIKTGTLKEVEPVGIAYVNLEQTVTDFFPWNHPLPMKQK